MGRKNRRIRDKRLDDLVIGRAEVHMNQHADKFGDRRDKRNRDRSTRERNAIDRDIQDGES